MLNINKPDPYINKLLQDKNLSTKIYIYMSSKSAGDDFDPYEKNYTYTTLNPKVIKGYVREIKPEALVWKQYGLKEMGAKEIICEAKYAEWFRLARKIEIDNDEYIPYLEGMPKVALITKRPFSIIRVVVFKKD